MKSLILALIFATVIPAAAGPRVFIDLQPGQRVAANIAGTEFVSLRVVTSQKDGTEQPQVRIVKASPGFQCWFERNILLTSAFDPGTRSFRLAWEIRLRWMPANGGCRVMVTHSSIRPAFVDLYLKN